LFNTSLISGVGARKKVRDASTAGRRFKSKNRGKEEASSKRKEQTLKRVAFKRLRL